MSVGYQEVDALMDNVYKAIGRHLPQSSNDAVDIYNRAYETVAYVYSRLVTVTSERDILKAKLAEANEDAKRLAESSIEDDGSCIVGIVKVGHTRWKANRT
jgi:Lon protease-like protein